MSTTFDPAQLGQQLKGEAEIPPLEKWNPAFCGDIDMRIAADGRWFYEGSPIGREAMIRMFARVLWREGGKYFLKTPVEKVGIQVDEVPFFVTQVELLNGPKGSELIFTTSTGDRVRADEDHPLRVETDPVTGEPAPFLMIRFGMEGKLSRSVFYEIVALAYHKKNIRGDSWIVNSAGVQFVLGEV